MNGSRDEDRVPICYLAPWVDVGGSDKGTIDWFRWLDRDRFAATLVTTQPSRNRRLEEVRPYAEEIWPLPDFLAGQHFPPFVFDLLHTRGIRVLHIMNSRIGFDLLPDLASLPRPPAVVVQLHVEEPDRSGYVRYVTTRYGNLVDAFSVSSRHLAAAVEAYDVAPSKIHVIPTGVDAELEFNPRIVTGSSLGAEDRFEILYAGRLTEQKDPLLMVEVIRRIVAAGRRFHVHVVGDGPLEDALLRRIRTAGLESHFTVHPSTNRLAPWYAACDLLLMTSQFEGVPYAIYEAMAMELPVVAPALPGNVELMANTAGELVAPRDCPDGYADAILAVMDAPDRGEGLARAGRSRVREQFSLPSMGRSHAELYCALLQSRRHAAVKAAKAGQRASGEVAVEDANGRSDGAVTGRPLRFLGRPRLGQPMVSVIVPCFNHGRFLPDCVSSALEQEYGDLEVIVVDDASTDEATRLTLSRIVADPRVRVLFQRENCGPSAARNRGVDEAAGRYILPLDADNILLPGALGSLVGQIQAAGECVGYIYPNCQYFGTRDDYFQPPSFNLSLLLESNYCDTCSLIDRDIFDAGHRYAEDIVLGHEDWDFVLKLAAVGVRGEPARGKTLLYRKHGFTRSDSVEYARRSFHEEIRERHVNLYGDKQDVGQFGRWRGPAARVKARDAPAMSIVMLAPVDFSTEGGQRLAQALASQSCQDYELLAECARLPEGEVCERIRRIPPGLCGTNLERLQEGIVTARGEVLVVGGADVSAYCSDVTFVERLHRTLWASPEVEAVAFADAPDQGPQFRLLGDGGARPPAQVLAWRVAAHDKLPPALRLSEARPAESLARAMSVNAVCLQWRSAPDAPRSSGASVDREDWIKFRGRDEEADAHRRAERESIAALPPALPALRWDSVRRWLGEVSWLPPGTGLLTRHRELDGTGRIVKSGRTSPPGYRLEHDLGAIQQFAPPGTVRLLEEKAGFRTVPRGSPRRPGEHELGHLECAPLPLFQTVERARLEDGTETLVSGVEDSVRAAASELQFLGYIEPFPNGPRAPTSNAVPMHGMVGLLRCVDMHKRRHVYRLRPAAEVFLVGELGALHQTAEPGSIAVWLSQDGAVSTAEIPVAQPPAPSQLMHWAVAPLAWRHFGHHRGRMRSALRRGFEAATIAAQSRISSWEPGGGDAGGASLPIGYLYPDGGPGRRGLFAAVHPVTGDQLLTHYPLEASDMGYGEPVELGWVLEEAPITGHLDTRRVALPWASRFGLEVRKA